jgi:hypothetical protein
MQGSEIGNAAVKPSLDRRRAFCFLPGIVIAIVRCGPSLHRKHDLRQVI